MVHPLLFLQFIRNLLEPLHINEASADAIAEISGRMKNASSAG